MGIKRYELSEAQWRRIEAMLPGKASDPGRTAADNRLFINGVLWVLRSGARWSDLPERYGKYKTVHKRFTRWARAGVWEGIFALLARDRDNEYLMIESSIVRAHAQAATGQKGGVRTGSGALPRGTDLQVAHRGRHTRPPSALHPHRRQCLRFKTGDPAADRSRRRPCSCRQGLRHLRNPRLCRSFRCPAHYPAAHLHASQTRLRSGQVQVAQPHRANHRQAQATPPHRHPIRPHPSKLPSKPMPRRNQLLVLNVDST